MLACVFIWILRYWDNRHILTDPGMDCWRQPNWLCGIHKEQIFYTHIYYLDHYRILLGGLFFILLNVNIAIYLHKVPFIRWLGGVIS